MISHAWELASTCPPILSGSSEFIIISTSLDREEPPHLGFCTPAMATVSWCIDPHFAGRETWTNTGRMINEELTPLGNVSSSLEQKAPHSSLALLFPTLYMVLDHFSVITPFSFMRLEV